VDLSGLRVRIVREVAGFAPVKSGRPDDKIPGPDGQLQGGGARGHLDVRRVSQTHPQRRGERERLASLQGRHPGYGATRSGAHFDPARVRGDHLDGRAGRHHVGQRSRCPDRRADGHGRGGGRDVDGSTTVVASVFEAENGTDVEVEAVAAGVADEPGRVAAQTPAAAPSVTATITTTGPCRFHNGRFRMCLPRMASTLVELAGRVADRSRCQRYSPPRYVGPVMDSPREGATVSLLVRSYRRR
jgi:hypothetical protein